ncbi:MAG: lysophospholipase [Rickettsiales bacterium]|nr:lysophospholipase [Rickettsiales bacterium]
MPIVPGSRWFVGALALLLAACQPTEQAVQERAQSSMVTEDHVVAVDGTKLPLTHWLPKGKVKVVILALHGFNDYRTAFAAPAAYFAKQGIATYAYDQRGFGAAPATGIWAAQKNLTRDAAETLRALAEAYPKVPIYLLGESMGGAVAVSLLAQPDPTLPLSGAILSAPALWGSDYLHWFYRSTLWMGAHTMPWYTVTGSGLKIMASDNIPMLMALGQDPLVIKETRLDSIYGLVGLMSHAAAKVDAVRTPLLVLYGMQDQVIPPQPIYESLLRLKTPHRVAYYPEGYHMLMRDLAAERVWADIVSWITNPVKPLPSGYDRDWQARMLLHKKAPHDSVTSETSPRALQRH